MKQIRISLDCIKYDLYDVIQIVSNTTWLIRLCDSDRMYWLSSNTNPTQYQSYALENYDTHEIRYVYVKPA